MEIVTGTFEPPAKRYTTAITMPWADGSHTFQLGLRQLEELEKICGCGFGELSERILSGMWHGKDIYHIIRLALIGAGMAALDAKALCDFYAEKPLARADDRGSPVQTAIRIVGAVLTGVEVKPPDPAPDLAVAA